MSLRVVCRREFTTAGVAAGVSAGFHAPIGGLLFAMEDLSSFWTKTLSWQTFFCCVIAGVASQVFNIAFEGFNYRGPFGAFSVQVRRRHFLIFTGANASISLDGGHFV